MNNLSKAIEGLYDKLWGWLEGLIAALPNLLIAVLVMLAFWIFSGWVYSLVVRVFKSTEFNESLEHLIAYSVKICVILLGVIVALSILHLQKTVFSMLAGVGVIGLALGFAFQDLAANFVSGIMIAIRGPIRIGNVVEISGVTGTVIDIRIRDTLIRNFSGQDVIVPNKDFISNKMTNYSSFGKRKLTVEVGVSYDADLNRAKEAIVKALQSIDGILSDPSVSAYVKSFGGSAVNLEAFAWIEYPGSDYLGLKDAATIACKEALDDAGIGIPFPIRTIDLGEDASKYLSQMKGGNSN